MTKANTSRDTALKEEILNSSDKRMATGEKPGPIKSKVEIRRGTKKQKANLISAEAPKEKKAK